MASRSSRFAGAFIDGVLLLLAAFPIMLLIAIVIQGDSEEDEVGAISEIIMMFVAYVVMFILNGYLLVNRGQTIGKYLLNTQIVDANNNKLLPFMRVFVFRYLWVLPLAIIFALIPGADKAENVVNLVDALMIFGASHRCLHDYIAGSQVVMFRRNRPHL